MSSSGHCVQLYQQNVDTCFGFSDINANTLTASSCATSMPNKLSPGGSSVAGDVHLTPTACISKPTRKRSRASKRTPTTLLNADAKNFRSLVQQFTGCRRRSTSNISFGNTGSGPVTINFSLGKEHDHRNTLTDHASIPQPFVEDNCSAQSQLQQQDQEHHQHCYLQQELVSNEEQAGGEFSLESITADDFLLTSYNCFPRSSGSEIPQGFGMDDLYFLA